MAYRIEKNPDSGKAEIIIDGWENGIADSPYHGLTSIKNLNITFLSGAVYSNYKRTLNSPATGIGIPKYWTRNISADVYYIQDSLDKIWKSTSATGVWSQQAGNTSGTGSGVVVYKGYIFAFRPTAIDYFDLNGLSWTNSWQPNGASPALQSGEHMSIWGTDDIMYFTNGRYVGSLQEKVGKTFNPADATTYTYNQIALTLPSYAVSTWLEELGENLYIAAGKQLYQWDRTSTTFNQVPIFIHEDIKRVRNILNTLYITAGVKGNIYICNGYNISPWVKIPDSFFGVIDPQIAFGDIMAHRNKLYVGAAQAFPLGSVAGIFSVDLNTKVINFENQSSFGLTSSAGLDAAPQVLIDNDRANFDQYASAWYDGSNGGIDTNSNTLYTSAECVIESDLIPVGTYLDPRTFSNMEFKTDKWVDGTITVYARQSLSDTYTQIGQTIVGTTTPMVSDVYTPLSLQTAQWWQVKVEISAATTTSFNRLFEIRLRF